MKNLKNVISFEYFNVVKSKSFIITAVIFMVLAAGASFIPSIFALIAGGFGNDEREVAAYVDRSGVFTIDILEEHFPEYDWVLHESIGQMIDAVEIGDITKGVYFIGQTEYSLVFAQGMMGPPNVAGLEEMVRNTFTRNYLQTEGLSQSSIDALLEVSIDVHFMPVGGAGFIVAQIALFLVFMPLMFGGSYISMAIVSEKTSKTVELLFTSAKPLSIMVGKVIAGVLIIGTLFGGIFIVAMLSLSITNSMVMEFISPQVLSALLDPHLYIYVVFFFLSAFISYAFLFAALAATVRDAQEASSVQTIPAVLGGLSFYAAFFVAASPRISDPIVSLLSYLPMVSPFIMIVRVTTSVVPVHELFIAIGVNVLTVIGIAFISARIYEKCIMLYGQKIGILKLFKK